MRKEVIAIEEVERRYKPVSSKLAIILFREKALVNYTGCIRASL